MGLRRYELAACGVDQVSAALEVLERLGVGHVLGFRVQRTVQGHHIAGLGQAFQGFVIGQFELFFHGVRQAVTVPTCMPSTS